jgi:kynurenine formamidase
MGNFIELTASQDNSKFLLNANHIKLITPQSNGAVVFVATANDSRMQYDVKETYDEIRLQLLATIQLNYKYKATIE